MAAWEAGGGPTSGAKAPPPAGSSDDLRAAESYAKGDACFANRGDRAQLECAIAAWDEAAKLRATWDLYAKLSRATFLLADGYVRFETGADQRDRYLARHQQGIRYGELAMMQASTEFASQVQGGAKAEDAIAALSKDHVPAMYWYATNFGRWANEMGTTTVLLYKDMIRKVMTRCLELDEDYFYAGPHRYFGAFYAKAPSFAGGDMDKSKEHFEIAKRKFPHYLATFTTYAEFYAVKQQDRDLFRELLDYVDKADGGAMPEVAVENSIEKKKAKALLDKEGDLL